MLLWISEKWFSLLSDNVFRSNVNVRMYGMGEEHQLAQTTPSLAMESLPKIWHCYLFIVDARFDLTSNEEHAKGL